LAEYALCVPGTPVPVEGMFSQSKLQRLPEKSRLNVSVLLSLFIIKANFDENC
jgi:hypothetical protein